MNNILEKYIVDTENVFDDEFEYEDLKKDLKKLLNEMSIISSEEWIELFSLMNTNSVGKKINQTEAYTVATSKIIYCLALKNNYLFANYKNNISFFNSKYWAIINLPLFKEFLKTASNKIGIPEYIASSVGFINKLRKQFIQDAYFEKIKDKHTSFINLKNGTLTINTIGVKLESHHPKYPVNYILDYDYLEDQKKDFLLDTLKNAISSVDAEKTFQQSISQVLAKNFYDDRKICLHNINKNIVNDFIDALKEVIPHELITTHFKNDEAQLEDLFIDFTDIKKDKPSLEKIIFIPFGNSVDKNSPIYNHSFNPAAILNWLIEGAKEIIKNRQIHISKECENFKERFNLVSLFVKEVNLTKTVKDSKSTVTTYENVLKQYQSFCELHDEEPLGRGNFNKELKALGFESTRRESGNVWFAKFA